MTKDKDIKTVVPALRFPEFRKSGKWEDTTLGAEVHYENGKAHENNIEESGNYIVVNSKFISADGEVVKYTNTPNCLAEKGDILMVLSDIPNGRAIAKCFIVDSNNRYTVNQRICRLKPKDASGKFLYYIIDRNSYLLSFDDGVKQTNLKKEDVLKCPFKLPNNLLEQVKIADCLSSLDDLISAVADKIEALKEYKKGLMQQLFPAEGKTIPAFRFPEFQNAGGWKKKVLSEVCKLVRGPFGGALKKEIFVEDGYAVYEQSHAINGNMSIFRYYITKDKFHELIRFAVYPNDIIMSCSGTMGKFSIIPENHKEGVINQALLKLSTKKGNDYKFIKLLLELPSNQEQLLSESAGGAIKNVASVGEIKEMSLCIPMLKEQRKIADCLSFVDELLFAENSKLNQLKAHKKGLMQQLFPTINK